MNLLNDDGVFDPCTCHHMIPCPDYEYEDYKALIANHALALEALAFTRKEAWNIYMTPLDPQMNGGIDAQLTALKYRANGMHSMLTHTLMKLSPRHVED